MKKNFLTVAALMVTAFFAATTVAQAADVTFGGEITSRFESNEHGGVNNSTSALTGAFDDASDADDYIQSRIRLNANIKVNDSTSAFIQLQSNRTWGADGGNATASSANVVGDGDSSVNDQDASVGIHQAYFVLKNFATLPVDLQVGRQEVILDGHRLFGNTIWTMGMQAHDAIRLTHKHDNMSLVYLYIDSAEDAAPVGNNINDRNDVESHVIYGSYQGILGGTLSTTFSYTSDGCGSGGGTAVCGNLADDLYNFGFRQAGQLYGIDYRAEYYYQWGDADATAAGISGATGRAPTSGTPVDRDAYMFGIRVGKTFKNVTMKPGLTVWYDYLSGTSDSDLDGANPTYKSFNTLFDTGHKFYGLQDLFLGIGGGGSAGGTAGLGLEDLAIKTKLSPMPGWTLKADYHWFWTAESVSGSRNAITTDGNVGDALGNELDVSLSNKYNANTNITLGFSNFTTTTAFRSLRDVRGAGANWAYLQFMVKF